MLTKQSDKRLKTGLIKYKILAKVKKTQFMLTQY
jgi:hypothetical protein